MNFDTKIAFIRMAHSAAVRQVTDPPTDISHSTAVAHDGICLVFLIAAGISLATSMLLPKRRLILPKEYGLAGLMLKAWRSFIMPYMA